MRVFFPGGIFPRVQGKLRSFPSGWRKRHSILSKEASNLYQALRNTGNARRLRLSYDQVIDNMTALLT
jgi:hypothetical protein